MPITEPEWQSIRQMVEEIAGQYSGRKNLYFISSPVVKRDDVKKLVWIKEFGDQPIPVVGFRYLVKYYDETPHGTTTIAAGNPSPYKVRLVKTEAEVITPEIGTIVLVVREMGTFRLPRCLGEIQGIGWLVEEEE